MNNSSQLPQVFVVTCHGAIYVHRKTNSTMVASLNTVKNTSAPRPIVMLVRVSIGEYPRRVSWRSATPSRTTSIPTNTNKNGVAIRSGLSI